MSVILRTAGIDRSAEELAWDLENLLTVWEAIMNVVLERKSPFLIYRESDSVVRALRDYLTNEIWRDPDRRRSDLQGSPGVCRAGHAAQPARN